MPIERHLSLCWFFMLASLGSFFPYFPLYLRENVGLTGTEVGIVFAALPLTGVLAQPFWGQLADRTGSRSTVLALLTLGAAAGYVVITLPGAFEAMLLATPLLAFFSAPLQPMAVSVTMGALGSDRAVRFGVIRAVGTCGFLTTAWSMPRLLDLAQAAFGWESVTDGPSEPGLGHSFHAAALLVLVAGALAFRLPQNRGLRVRANREDYRLLLRHSGYLRLLGVTLLGYLVLHGPMILFPVYVRARGGDMQTLGNMWVWMVLLEIPLVARAGNLLERLGPRFMIGGAVLAGGVRWLVCAHTDRLIVMYPIQMLHALVVAGLIVGAPIYIESLVPEQLRSTGQAGLLLAGASVGGILSSTLAGMLMDSSGIEAVYRAGGLGGVAVGALGLLLLPRRLARSEV